MADKIIGSLLYDDHPIPRKSRAWKDRLKVPVAIAIVLLVIGGAAWKFANFREEGRVRQFIGAVQGGNYEAAYQWISKAAIARRIFSRMGRDGFYARHPKGPSYRFQW
jgi:hypothetical protein